MIDEASNSSSSSRMDFARSEALKRAPHYAISRALQRIWGEENHHIDSFYGVDVLWIRGQIEHEGSMVPAIGMVALSQEITAHTMHPDRYQYVERCLQVMGRLLLEIDEGCLGEHLIDHLYDRYMGNVTLQDPLDPYMTEYGSIQADLAHASNPVSFLFIQHT